METIVIDGIVQTITLWAYYQDISILRVTLVLMMICDLICFALMLQTMISERKELSKLREETSSDKLDPTLTFAYRLDTEEEDEE